MIRKLQGKTLTEVIVPPRDGCLLSIPPCHLSNKPLRGNQSSLCNSIDLKGETSL